MNPRMPKGAAPKLYLGVHARLVFLKKEDEQAVLDLFPGPQRGRKASFQGSLGSQKGSTDGRNPSGANPWRVLRVGLFLPLLGLEAPRDLSPLKPVLNLAPLTQGPWKGWKVGLGPPPGGRAGVH